MLKCVADERNLLVLKNGEEGLAMMAWREMLTLLLMTMVGTGVAIVQRKSTDGWNYIHHEEMH